MFGLSIILASTISAGPLPTLTFERPEVQTRLGFVFEKALENLTVTNTVPYDPATYNRTHLLKGGKFLRAGGDYEQPWTRDASINSWNAASLLIPDIARDTLWAVTVPDEKGELIVQRDNQWWDKVVWIVGAWNHFKTTGDREFLTKSYGVASRLLAEMRATRYDDRFGLFRGPSFFNDGIAGYPSPPADANDGGSSFVLDHAGTDRIMALSTNCVYVGAYNTARDMATELHRPAAEVGEWKGHADRLKDAINRRFWRSNSGLYGYLLDEAGKLDPSEEGCGLSFAVLFDVASKKQTQQVMQNAHEEPFGITDVYPHFPRFSDERPGRHNAIVWPMVQGMWARAAVKAGSLDRFREEAERLTDLVLGSKGRFYEIYNAKSGKVDGGWQNGHSWGSVPDQTWSASAYVSMMVNGLFGLRFEPNGIRFQPTVPKEWGSATLRGLRYRESILDVQIQGAGVKVKSVRLDGRSVREIPATLTGAHTVLVTMR